MGVQCYTKIVSNEGQTAKEKEQSCRIIPLSLSLSTHIKVFLCLCCNVLYTLCVGQSGELVSEPVECPIPKKWVRLGLGLG